MPDATESFENTHTEQSSGDGKRANLTIRGIRRFEEHNSTAVGAME
jgi:hypothetical protein